MTKVDKLVPTPNPLQIGVAGNGTIKVHFKVTKAGTYADFTNTVSGDTEGLRMDTVRGGNFTVGNDQTLIFSVSGTPYTSLDGNSFAVSRITTSLETGKILGDPVTGGTSVATVSKIDTLVTTVPLKIRVAGSGTIKVHFNVTKAGTYADFTNKIIPGHNDTGFSDTWATTGLRMDTVRGGNFTVGDDQTLSFIVSGTPDTSFNGNSFAVSRITTLLNTGKIKGFTAICDGTKPTQVVEITGRSGRKWMDRNLGASRVAESKDDYEAFGCLYQWGRGNDGAASMNWSANPDLGELINGQTDARTSIDSPGNQYVLFSADFNKWWSSPDTPLWQGVDGKNNPCPAGYRIPTREELEAELNGVVVNSNTAYSSSLKLVNVGSMPVGILRKYEKGYWSSTTRYTFDHSYRYIAFTYSDKYQGGSTNLVYATTACSVRCIKN